MPQISLLLPSIRPGAARRCIELTGATAGAVDYEVVLVGAFPVDLPHVRWVEMHERRGVTVAQQAALEAATGRYVVALSDYLMPRPGWLDTLVAALDATGDSIAVLGPLCVNALSAGEPAVSFAYGYHYPFFPAASQRTIERIGGWYDTAFRSHFCDSDIALRAWRAGGHCDVVWSSTVVVAADRDQRQGDPAERAAKDYVGDAERWLDRWHPVYGAGWPRRAESVNQDVALARLPHPRLSEVRLQWEKPSAVRIPTT